MIKNIFITGGTTGIGLALAELYLQQGHRVGVCGRDLSKIKIQGLKTYEVDVCDRQQLISALHDFAKVTGSLDIVIANAGVGMPKKSAIPDFSKAREVIEINVLGVLNTFEGALEIMLNQNQNQKGQQGRGHLVAIASVAGMIGLPGTAAYSASKAAVLKLCESFSIDLPPLGIDITAVAPGFIDTPLTRRNRHPMPFLMPADKAAKIIAKAIHNKKALLIFPFPMFLIVSILYHLPRCLYRHIVGLFYRPHQPPH